MDKMLWLASWYPNRLENLSGDFIERHARAVSLLYDIEVIHVLKDHMNVTPGKVFSEARTYNPRLRATVIYYKVALTGLPRLHAAISGILFLKHFLSAVRRHISKHGKPRIVHVHVAQRAGWVALALKYLYNIPYVVTEHWTGYCKEAQPNFDDAGFVERWLWKKVMKHASGCTAVSDHLGRALQSRLRNLTYTVIPNVVDTSIFNPVVKNEVDDFSFIHVSTLSLQKNPEQILNAISKLYARTDRKFRVLIYGPHKPELVQLAETMHLGSIVTFKKEVLQPELAKDMQMADALVLYSKFETFGCVIIEANACGLPVIVSDLPVLREIVEENVNGIFAPLDEPELLSERLLWMMKNKSQFNSAAISRRAEERFRFETVAREFDIFYKQALPSPAELCSGDL